MSKGHICVTSVYLSNYLYSSESLSLSVSLTQSLRLFFYWQRDKANKKGVAYLYFIVASKQLTHSRTLFICMPGANH